MMQENPSEIKEAFSTNESRVFPVQNVMEARATCTEPIFTGYLKAPATRGKEALVDIEFVPDVTGELKLWRKPNMIPAWLIENPEEPFYKDENGVVKLRDGYTIENRYVAVYDPAKGISEKASKSASLFAAFSISFFISSVNIFMTPSFVDSHACLR